MVQIRMMAETDMEALYADPGLKQLLVMEPWGSVYCIVAEENGKLVGGLSGSIADTEAALQVCVAGEAGKIGGLVLTEGLIRSILYVLDKRGVGRGYMTMDVAPAIAEKIGFAPIGKDQLPDWIKKREGAWAIDVKEFLAQDCCGCKHNG